MKQRKTREQKREEQRFYRQEYNFLDSGKMFLNVLVYPLAVALIFSFLVIFVTYFSGHQLEDALNTWIYKFFSIILTQATFFVIFVLYNRKYRVNVWKAAKINKDVNPWGVVVTILMSVACVFLIAPFINLINYVFSLIGYNPSGDLPYSLNTIWDFLYVVVATALIPAIVEELLMRGVVFQGCLKKWNPVKAIVIGGVLFMLMHGALQQTVYQFILGVILCYIMYEGKNIIYPMVFHFVNNFTVVLVTYISKVKGVADNGPTFTTALDFILPIVYLLIAGGIVVGGCFLFRYIMKHKRTPAVESEVRPEMIEMIDEGVDETTVAKLVDAKNKIESQQKVYFYVALAVGCVIWLVNTLSEIL